MCPLTPGRIVTAATAVAAPNAVAGTGDGRRSLLGVDDGHSSRSRAVGVVVPPPERDMYVLAWSCREPHCRTAIQPGREPLGVLSKRAQLAGDVEAVLKAYSLAEV